MTFITIYRALFYGLAIAFGAFLFSLDTGKQLTAVYGLINCGIILAASYKLVSFRLYLSIVYGLGLFASTLLSMINYIISDFDRYFETNYTVTTINEAGFIITLTSLFCFFVLRVVDVGRERTDKNRILKKRFVQVFSIYTVFAEVYLILMNVVFDAHNSPASLGFLVSLIPATLNTFTMLYFLVKYRINKFSDFTKIIFYSYFVLFLLRALLAGQRGTLFTIALLFFVFVLRYFPMRKIGARLLVMVSLGLVLSPIFVGLGAFFKSEVHHKQEFSRQKELSLDRVALDVFNVTEVVLSRFGGYYFLLKSVQSPPTGIEQHITLPNIADTYLSSVLPSAIYQRDSHSLGKISSVYWSGNPWDVKNSGAMFLLPLLYLLFGFGSFIALPIIMLIVLFVQRRFIETPIVSIIFSYTGFVTIFSTMISGNIDSIMGQYTQNVLIYLFLIYFMRFLTSGKYWLKVPLPKNSAV